MKRYSSWISQKAWFYALLAGLVVLGAWSKMPAAGAQEPPVNYSEHAGGGGGRNLVIVRNRVDGGVRIRSAIQLSRIPGPAVEPVNYAGAFGSCADCQTMSVALQLNLVSQDVARFMPQNVALAVNVECTRCVTVAYALQYVVQVEDPAQVPQDVLDYIHAMEHALRDVADRGVTICEALATVNGVVDQFHGLANSLSNKQFDTPEPLPCLGPQ